LNTVQGRAPPVSMRLLFLVNRNAVQWLTVPVRPFGRRCPCLPVSGHHDRLIGGGVPLVFRPDPCGPRVYAGECRAVAVRTRPGNGVLFAVELRGEFPMVRCAVRSHQIDSELRAVLTGRFDQRGAALERRFGLLDVQVLRANQRVRGLGKNQRAGHCGENHRRA
jgi:hypothetical protein